MLDAHRWQEISPYLDQALALSDEERTAWLQSIRGRNPELAEALEALLDEHCSLAKKKFLDETQVSRPAPRGLAGRTIGAYTLVSQIGRGGMGTVWLAQRRDGRFERQVAVKFLRLALVGRGAEKRFKREGSILGRLTHPNIAELIDAGVCPSGETYLILEYVEGEHIDRYCDRCTFDVAARIRLFLDVLAAVAHAHSSLIVHCDIKPSNVLVRIDGQVKLLDFGIAKLLQDEAEGGAATWLTTENGRPMTPACAAPEQLRGEAVTTATDVYGLGVLLYILLTGQHPAGIGVHSYADLVRSTVETEPAPASEAVAATQANVERASVNAAKRGTTPDKLHRLLRGDLDVIVGKSLKKNPHERYSSVGALADDLRRYLRNQPISARPDTITYRAAKFVRRHRAALAAATLAITATVAGLAGTLIQARTARIQRDFALRQVKRSAALSEFHQFLLSDAAPSGKALTINELLNRAQQIVARQHAANDPDRIELMVSIGREYLEHDAAANARQLLGEAYKRSRRLSDPSIRAAASCALASSLARDEELKRAEALLDEGLRELPKAPQFALERMSCLQNGSEIALERNEVWKGIARAETAQRVLRQSPFDSDVLEMHVWINLAKAYSTAGRDTDALSAYKHAAALVSSLGRDDTDTAAVLFNAWALKLDQMGRPLDAEKMYRRSIDIMRESKTEEAVSPILLCNYARTLRELGKLEVATDYAERSYDKAQRIGHQLAINLSLLERARIYTAQHNSSRAAAMLAEVQPRLQQSLPPGHYAFAALASEQALNALQRGDIVSALKLADQAVSIDEAAIKAGQDGIFYLPNLLIRRSTIELEARRPDQAAADAERALSQLQRTAQPGAFSSAIGHAYLILGRALDAEGKHDQAHAAFQYATEHLQHALGENHPDACNARRLAQAQSRN